MKVSVLAPGNDVDHIRAIREKFANIKIAMKLTATAMRVPCEDWAHLNSKSNKVNCSNLSCRRQYLGN